MINFCTAITTHTMIMYYYFIKVYYFNINTLLSYLFYIMFFEYNTYNTK